MEFKEGQKAAIEICEALELPADEVHSLTIKLHAGEIAYVDVDLYISAKKLKQVAETMKRYKLVPKE